MDNDRKIADLLFDETVWREYAHYKDEGGHIRKGRLEALEAFIARKGYLVPAQKVRDGRNFSYPEKKLVNKLRNGRKRAVYTWPEDENYVLKLMAYLLLRRYDHLFAPNLYSFRMSAGVPAAIARFTAQPQTAACYVYKADIHDYFRSVDVEQLLPMLEPVRTRDPEVYDFISALLRSPYALWEGEVVEEPKGIMAGCPIAVFLANVYLSDMDRHFQAQHRLYGRYSDDIIVFTQTEAERSDCVRYIRQTLQERGLSINPDKEMYCQPHEEWTFLGISCRDGVCDISKASAEKLRQKMRRKARALERWKRRKSASGERAARAFIRVMNRKLYDNPVESELTWTRWYFPMINTTATLKSLDHYMQECIRYIATGKRNHGRYRFTYEDMKRLGYRSLVHEYYVTSQSEC